MTTPDRRALLQAAMAFTLCGAGSANARAGATTDGSTGPASAPVRSPAGRTSRRRAYVDSRFGQLHVTTTSPASKTPRAGARTPVLCLPMSPRSGRDFDEFAAHLADRRVVHCPDVPGYGGSDAPPDPPAVDDYAAAILDGLDRFDGVGRRQPVDIVGQHTGAAVAVEMARQQPARIRRLVLIGVPMFEAHELDELRRSFAKPRPYFEDPEFVGTAWKRDLAALKGGLSEAAMLMRFTEILRAGPRSWWGFNAVFGYPMRERIAALRQPVLTIALDERLQAPTREAAKLVPNGRCLDIPELSGAALDFAADRIATAARAFLDEA